jgi:AraC-like DNA-binding protein
VEAGERRDGGEMTDWKERAPDLDYLAQLPATASVLIQLDPGHLGLAGIDVRGKDSFIIRSTTGARSIWTVVPEPDWIGYTIPITWKGDFILNGMIATRTTVFRLDGTKEYDFVAEHRDAISVGIRRSVFTRTMSGLIGRDFSPDVDTHRQLHVSEPHWHRLLGILWKPLAWASSNGSGNGFHRLPRSIEVAFIEAIADWTVETDQLNDSKPVSRKNDLRIVRNSLRKIREADNSLLTIPDLCHLAGVGKSRLHQAFSEIYGISPGAYLYRLRLTSIREKLLSEEAPARSVKDVAIQHGFLSSGQFARAYRDMFGELPSQTFRARKASSGSVRRHTLRTRLRCHPSLAPNTNSNP